MNAGPIVHVGYHKTGTTWLQLRLFNHPSHGLLKLRPYRVSQALIWPNALDFDPTVARSEFLDPWRAEADQRGLVPIISLERLSGHLESGGYDSRELADRIHAALPQATILIVIREQRSALLSSYKQYAKAGGVLSLRKYLLHEFHQSYPALRFEHFAYDRLIGYYQSLFGEDRVVVMAFEDFRADPRTFVESICELCGVAFPDDLDVSQITNESLSMPTLLLRRNFNRLFLYGVRNPGAPFPLSIDHKAKLFQKLDRLVPRSLGMASDHKAQRVIAEIVGDRYQASNRRTAELTGLDLAGYGYDLGNAEAALAMAAT